MINVFKNWYVGIRKQPGRDDDRLAFVTQDTGDASFKTRKNNVVRWAGGDWNHENDQYTLKLDTAEEKSFENVPTEGFHILTSVTRWETSNKWFRVADPRGWIIEISAKNLATLIENFTIEKGIVKAPLIYGKDNQNIYLTWPNNPQNVDPNVRKAGKVKVSSLKPGDRFSHAKKEYMYFGELDYMVAPKLHQNGKSNYGWNRNGIRNWLDKYPNPEVEAILNQHHDKHLMLLDYTATKIDSIGVRWDSGMYHLGDFGLKTCTLLSSDNSLEFDKPPYCGYSREQSKIYGREVTEESVNKTLYGNYYHNPSMVYKKDNLIVLLIDDSTH